jgi:hypothetical protein
MACIAPVIALFAANVVIVSQKDKKRFCLDYRPVNDASESESYPIPQLKDVVMATSFAHTEQDKLAMNLLLARQEMGKPFLAPPGLPPERVAELRRAFMATMRDPAYLEMAGRLLRRAA